MSASRRYARIGVWLGHAGSPPPRLGVNLLLVPVGSLYRPALPISHRTELATAFARGASQLYVPSDPFAPQNRRLSILLRIAKTADTKLAARDGHGATEQQR